MMRNAPDLETRMKLQEISDRLANNKGNSFAGYEEGKGGQGKRIPGFQVNRGSPSMPARAARPIATVRGLATDPQIKLNGR
jgi:hypothetical protein